MTFNPALYDRECWCGHSYGWYELGATFSDGSPMEELTHYRSAGGTNVCSDCLVDEMDQHGNPISKGHAHDFVEASVFYGLREGRTGA